MKYKIIIFFFLVSCTSINTYNKSDSYSSTGFAYIFNLEDYKNKIINRSLNNDKLEVGHNLLNRGTLIIISNPINNKSMKLSINKKINYPDFYKIAITKKVADNLEINEDLPIVDIREIKKNKSFLAKKAKTFEEEQTISANAPVTKVDIVSLGKNKLKETNNKKKFSILIGDFYSSDTTNFLKERLKKEMLDFDIKKLKTKNIKVNNKTRIEMISGPYKSINLLKQDYMLLKKFGFEDLNILIND